MPVSGDTLLRLIGTVPLPVVPTPRLIGIDDWAWRRGQGVTRRFVQNCTLSQAGAVLGDDP